MSRTNADDVIEILGGNYGPNEADTLPSLTGFITAANSLVNRISAKYPGVLAEADLTVIECWLAAHFYGHSDQFYKSKNTQSAGATFQGETKMGLSSTQYGQTAMMLDTTRYLAALDKGGVVSSMWLGDTTQSDVDYPMESDV